MIVQDIALALINFNILTTLPQIIYLITKDPKYILMVCINEEKRAQSVK